MKKLYTRAGDSGFSTTLSQSNIPKTDIVFDLLGGIDEASSTLLLAYALCGDEKFKEDIKKICSDLVLLCGEIAGGKRFVTPEIIKCLETKIDEYCTEGDCSCGFLPLTDNPAAAAVSVARAVVRRAERCAVKFYGQKSDKGDILKYLNRLSDFLYALSRQIANELKT
ncbi:MAG: Cob(I)yrinic acid a,c-diamide adenosyltransferase [Firmicutes bacterium ADurb.Bin193]|nr:MAG: Cob(I)yrinic acid a,c-diamide adenosyltransferase [Firmicutes bacterium ADurb.Bin193]